MIATKHLQLERDSKSGVNVSCTSITPAVFLHVSTSHREHWWPVKVSDDSTTRFMSAIRKLLLSCSGLTSTSKALFI